MATQDSILTYTGSIADKTGYVLNDKHFVRSKPKNVRQSPRTRLAAQRFGMSSKTAASIRKSFYPELTIPKDGAHINRLTKLLIPSAGKDLKSIVGYRFNKTQNITSHFTIPPKITKHGKVHIPAQTFPQGPRILNIKLIAADTHHTISKTLTIDTTQPFPGITLDVNLPGTSIIVLQVNNSAEIIAIHESFISPVLHDLKLPLLSGHTTITTIQRE